MDMWSDFLLVLTSAPWSAPFIVLVSVFLNLISIWATARFTDVEKLKENMAFVKEWQAKFNEARKTMDPLLLQEVQDMQSRVMSINAQMMTARCKPYLIFIIPFMAIFYLLSAMYGNTIVAVIPFHIEEVLFFMKDWLGFTTDAGFGLTYYSWYLLTSFGLGGFVRKIFGQDAMGV
ncbi:MAG: EMC3/TMCO1 family protein [Candidatus Thorarchaeota archaeon]